MLGKCGEKMAFKKICGLVMSDVEYLSHNRKIQTFRALAPCDLGLGKALWLPSKKERLNR